MGNPENPSPQATEPKSDEPSAAREVEGEGSYTATRRYNANIARHQSEEDVDALAEKAREAVEGEQAEELEEAEEAGRKGPGVS